MFARCFWSFVVVHVYHLRLVHWPPGVPCLQVGWGCHWRLVYLLYTGQQQSISMFTALQQAQAMFQSRYPDFSDWLAR